MIRSLLAALFLLQLCYSAIAQTVVVPSCDATGLTYGTGTGRPYAIDPSGRLCTSAGGGGGADSNVNINEINGNAPSATNPLWVSPATGATFPVSGTVAATQSGTWNVGVTGTVTVGTHAVTQSGTWTVQPGNTQNTTPWLTTSAPSSVAGVAITPVVTGAAANNLVLKAAAGNLYSVYATNLTATAGFLVVLNATVAPADGAMAPLDCVPLPANGNASISYDIPARYSAGMVAIVTSAATCFTKTTGTITAFIKGGIQ